MDQSYFRHQSDSRYCFSIDEHRTKVRLAVAKRAKIGKVELVYGDEFRFADTRKAIPMEIRHEDLDYCYYEAIMEAKIPRFFYIFHIESEEGSFDLYESGLTQSGFDYSLAFLSAFRHNGENRIDIVSPNPKLRGKIAYQIFPERFARGKEKKDDRYINRPWNAKGDQLHRGAFLGGDLYGVIEHLDYLSSINVGAIYLTPVHPSPSNHKYDVLDYFDVDPAFGGKEALRLLVEECHKRGIALIMDLVFNHCSVHHPFFEDVRKRGKESPYYSWFMIDGDRPKYPPLNYRCFSYAPIMPKLDTSNKAVQDYLIEVGRYWVKEFHVDGFRLDVSDAVSHYFWTRFKIAMRELDPHFFLLGENWLNAESFLGETQLDGVMNYPFLGVVGSYLLGQNDAETTHFKLDGLLMRYKDGNDENMFNILASHDIQRFLNLCRGDKDLALLGYAIMMFYIGIPMIYYGEEILMEGGGDPDCRRGMDWEKANHPDEYAAFFAELMRLRADPLFKEGTLSISAESGLLKMRRGEGKNALTLLLNAGKEAVSFSKAGKEILCRNTDGDTLLPKGILVYRG